MRGGQSQISPYGLSDAPVALLVIGCWLSVIGYRL